MAVLCASTGTEGTAEPLTIKDIQNIADKCLVFKVADVGGWGRTVHQGWGFWKRGRQVWMNRPSAGTLCWLLGGKREVVSMNKGSITEEPFAGRRKVPTLEYARLSDNGVHISLKKRSVF
ncbi:MAG: hypothetical protein JSW58_09830 [Candidatus Latescibacterota bacterium]|nr:MAG: hypothetical protein JSW58_09830 [Candidatus Latescibacterota bacterium]